MSATSAPVTEDPPEGKRAAPPRAEHWHTHSVEEVVAALSTSADGLSGDEAVARLRRLGPNELRRGARASAWRTFAGQFKNVLIVTLLVATFLSGLLGHTLEATVITIIVLFAVLLGFVQEHRAGRAIEALRSMAAPSARVRRDAGETLVPARDVVPGDVVVLHAGDRIPADARLTQAVNLAVDEAPLTGESTAAEKRTAALTDERLPVADRRNMVYAGTVVTHGRGQGIVVATGMSTEFGRIADLVEAVDAGRTPLQENLDRLGATLGKAALAVVALVTAFGLWRGLPPIEMFMFGIALAVAVVPEALPAVVTISLAIGVRRMVSRRALVRRLPVVETLGSTSVICTDKTGTITRNEMTVRQLFVDGRLFEMSGAGYEPQGHLLGKGQILVPPPAVHALLRAAALVSDARLLHRGDRWQIDGDPTEGALLVAATKAGIALESLAREEPRIDEVPFTSERRQMTTLHRTERVAVAYSKGAADRVLASCTQQLVAGEERPLDEEGRERFFETERQMAGGGLRVLALARKRDTSIEQAERGMTLLGLVAMMDPPRVEARAAVDTCVAAGIVPVMITGDHPQTASSVAREVGILGTRRVVSGRDLDEWTDRELDGEVGGIAVYARVSPAHKLRVVEAWQRRGHVVAMTGDGINDAPALKKADVGVAMGITGTDVSKEAAGMTLLDDNFATLVGAVEEGRIVFGNIKKYLMYLLSCNFGEIVLLAGAVLAGLPLPLSAVHILYVNLATDGLPALALAVDPPEADLMRRRPRNPRAGIFTPPVLAVLLAGGMWSAVVNMSLFTWLLRSGRPLEQVMTLTFVTLVLIQFFHAYNCRSERLSIVRAPFANRWLNAAVAWEVVMLAAIIYVPFFQRAFGTFGLAPADWLLTAGLAVSIVPVVECVKWSMRRALSAAAAPADGRLPSGTTPAGQAG